MGERATRRARTDASYYLQELLAIDHNGVRSVESFGPGRTNISVLIPIVPLDLLPQPKKAVINHLPSMLFN